MLMDYSLIVPVVNNGILRLVYTNGSGGVEDGVVIKIEHERFPGAGANEFTLNGPRKVRGGDSTRTPRSDENLRTIQTDGFVALV